MSIKTRTLKYCKKKCSTNKPVCLNIQLEKRKIYVQNTKFKKFISSLLFGIQIFIDLYSMYIDIYVTCATAKITDKLVFAWKRKERKKYMCLVVL